MKELTKDLLKVKIYTTTEEMGLSAAEDVAQRIMALLSEKPEINMIFAAAPSQSAFLSSLIKDKRIEWGRINAFHMDEYIGIPRTQSQSFGNFLSRSIFSHVPFKSVNYIDGVASDINAECERYSEIGRAHV